MVSRWARICPATSAAVQLAPAASRLIPVPRNSPNTTLMAKLLKSVATAVIAYVPAAAGARQHGVQRLQGHRDVHAGQDGVQLSARGQPAAQPPRPGIDDSQREHREDPAAPLEPGARQPGLATGVNEPGTS